jgi:hypothetical protein
VTICDDSKIVRSVVKHDVTLYLTTIRKSVFGSVGMSARFLEM